MVWALSQGPTACKVTQPLLLRRVATLALTDYNVFLTGLGAHGELTMDAQEFETKSLNVRPRASTPAAST
jgi:hypothetical protein